MNYLSNLNKSQKICEIRIIRSKASIRILLVMGKNNVPEGWEKYSKCGRRIPGTPFVAFKVPLSENLQSRYNQQFLSRASRNEVQEHRWTLDILSQTFDLNLVIDLTATDRYYNPVNINHVKIKTQGHVLFRIEMSSKDFSLKSTKLLKEIKTL